MIIATTGPSLTQLRKKIGTGEEVQFGDTDAIVMSVQALCAVGGYDLPIRLPGHAPLEEASTWFIVGDHETKESSQTVLVLATFTPSGRMICAAIAITRNEEEDAAASIGLHLMSKFKELLTSHFGNSD